MNDSEPMEECQQCGILMELDATKWRVLTVDADDAGRANEFCSVRCAQAWVKQHINVSGECNDE